MPGDEDGQEGSRRDRRRGGRQNDDTRQPAALHGIRASRCGNVLGLLEGLPDDLADLPCRRDQHTGHADQHRRGRQQPARPAADPERAME
ncbi:MAG TPA: hypothetical protein PKA20_21585 [Burkholderiaceae bacterium]|nr:hypothetical protein [Burkholderiaceae bacterium]